MSQHLYTCPNGHVYVIGDCGGATETGRCPHCGETVGGSGHQLLATNRRAADVVEQMREAVGALRSR